MTISRINWAALSPRNQRITPVVLIAGVPYVFTAAGVRPTSVSVSSGTIDRLFWPRTGTLTETLPGAGGTFDPVKDLLDPNETFEISEKLDLLKGEVRVEPFTFSLFDNSGQATALVSRRDSLLNQQLASDIDAVATSIPLVNTAGFPTGYIAAIGRETVTYDGIGGGGLVSATRGKYGSAARVHLSPVAHRGLVTSGGARHWQGRQASVWLCSLSADGLTLSDPTLIFLGSVAAGVQMTHNLTKWSIPLDPAMESLGRKLNLGFVDLYGYAHYTKDTDFYHPCLIVQGGLDASLTDEAADPNNGGWHPSRESFKADADRRATTVLSGVSSVHMGGDNRFRVQVMASGGVPQVMNVSYCWDTARWDNTRLTDSAFLPTVNPAPAACFHLEGWVKIPTAADFAKIPTTVSWASTTPGGVVGQAALALTADTLNTEGLVAEILGKDTTLQRILVAASLPNRSTLTEAQVAAAARCTSQTRANLGLVARGTSPVAALMAAAKGIDALSGEDLFYSSLDWEGLERAFNHSPTRITDAREYRFVNGDDTFLTVLSDECRLHGLCLAIANGLITAVKVGSFSITEPVTTTVSEANILRDGSGQEIPAEVIDNSRPLATSMKFEIPGADPGEPDTLTITDTTYQEEFGDGETVECRALMSLPMGTDLSGIQRSLVDVATQVLGGLAEPSREIRLAVSPHLLGLQPGNIIQFTHSRIPGWRGVRGINAACLVTEVRRSLFGGNMRGTVTIRLQSGDPVGYAPEALVAAGGLSASSPVVTLDTTSGWGAACFALPYGASGASTSNPSLGFLVGDKVRLSQFARAPIANESFTIVSIDTVANTVTLDANPTAGMVAAAVAYGVSLRFSAYGAAVGAQQTNWGWESDQTTQLLNGVDNTKRWA